MANTANGDCVITPTTFCNNNCLCCIHVRPCPKNKTLTWKEAIKNVDSFSNYKHIGISGGEPTLWKKLPNLIKYISEKYTDSDILLLSNARMFYYWEYVERISESVRNKDNFRVGCAIYGPDSQIHDRITCSDGSFSQTIGGIKNLLKNKIRVELRIIVNKINYKNLPEIANFIVRKIPEVFRIVFIGMRITGNAYKNRDSIAVRLTETVPKLQEALHILEKSYRGEISLYHYPPCILDSNYRKYNFGVTRYRNLILPDKCGKCELKENCPKIWESYIKNFGIEEFNPVIH